MYYSMIIIHDCWLFMVNDYYYHVLFNDCLQKGPFSSSMGHSKVRLVIFQWSFCHHSKGCTSKNEGTKMPNSPMLFFKLMLFKEPTLHFFRLFFQSDLEIIDPRYSVVIIDSISHAKIFQTWEDILDNVLNWNWCFAVSLTAYDKNG